jgi:hypothetical protein
MYRVNKIIKIWHLFRFSHNKLCSTCLRCFKLIFFISPGATLSITDFSISKGVLPSLFGVNRLYEFFTFFII